MAEKLTRFERLLLDVEDANAELQDLLGDKQLSVRLVVDDEVKLELLVDGEPCDCEARIFGDREIGDALDELIAAERDSRDWDDTLESLRKPF